MQVEIRSSNPPDGFKFPLSDQEINQAFESILIDSKLIVYFGCFENTSDVLIIRSPSEHPLKDWSLQILGCRIEQCDEISCRLLKEGLPRIRDWCRSSNSELFGALDVWQGFSLTLRYEGKDLLYFARIMERPHKRPPLGWDPRKQT